MGFFEVFKRHPDLVDQLTFLENDLSCGRRDAILKEADASLAPLPPTLPCKKGENALTGRQT
jgi:hypothetical protein